MASQYLPSTTSKKLVKFFLKRGFYKDRQAGSHLTLKHPDDRTITLPVHTGKDIGKGLLNKILSEVGYSIQEYNSLRLK